VGDARAPVQADGRLSDDRAQGGEREHYAVNMSMDIEHTVQSLASVCCFGPVSSGGRSWPSLNVVRG
jgi:hypothetical protein